MIHCTDLCLVSKSESMPENWPDTLYEFACQFVVFVKYLASQVTKAEWLEMNELLGSVA